MNDLSKTLDRAVREMRSFEQRLRAQLSHTPWIRAASDRAFIKVHADRARSEVRISINTMFDDLRRELGLPDHYYGYDDYYCCGALAEAHLP